MPSRSSDHSEGIRLESKWRHEALLYVFIIGGASGLYLTGTEWMMKWIEWFQGQVPAAQTAAPCQKPNQLQAQTAPLQQAQIQAMIQAQIQAQAQSQTRLQLYAALKR